MLVALSATNELRNKKSPRLIIESPKHCKCMKLIAYCRSFRRKRMRFSRSLPGQILVAMKLTVFFLTAVFLNVSAHGVSQDVSFSGTNISLEKVFSTIEKQTGYTVFYDAAMLRDASLVTLTVNKVSLAEFLRLVLVDQPFKFLIEDKNIILSRKSRSDNKARLTQLQTVANYPAPPLLIKVIDSIGMLLEGASIVNITTKEFGNTGSDGSVILSVSEGNVIVVSYIGMLSQRINVTKAMLENGSFSVILKADIVKLGEVEVVVNTGYQKLVKERATGSFEVIDNKTYSRSTASNFLDRLNGVASGLLLSRSGNNQSGNPMGLSIRGRSTLYSNTKPLIIVDNFPFEGDIASINPEDVESITLLKDAAAASIWGTLAGNGVLVVTTKRGQLNRPLQINITGTLNFSPKPDLHTEPHISTEDFIATERFLFSQGQYNGLINQPYGLISPVVEILARERSGELTKTEADAAILQISQYDFLTDMEQYAYKNQLTQQYHLGASGGGSHNQYYISAGYDKNNSYRIGNTNNRYTLKAANTFYSTNRRLEFGTELGFTQSNSQKVVEYLNSPKYPYQRLADENGNPVSYLKSGTPRESYTDTAGAGYLLDWKFRPLDEIRNAYSTNSNQDNSFLLNLRASYKIIDGLKLDAYYQYTKANLTYITYYAKESFYARDLVNQFSSIDPTTGALTRPIPLGAVMESNYYDNKGSNIRLQANYEKKWAEHQINFIGGYEERRWESKLEAPNVLLGYKKETETFLAPVDYITYYPHYYTGGYLLMPRGAYRTGSFDNNRSLFANLGYDFHQKYFLSASIRKDESNLFGVNTNQKGVSLWSVGAGWAIHRARFYPAGFINYLTLKATFGYSGNVDKSTSAYLTARKWASNNFGNPYNQIQNPPNPDLRWEQVENLNIALDFKTKSNYLQGSVEYYIKKGMDLMGNGGIAPQSGLSSFYGNIANTETRGVDIKLTSINLAQENLNWSTTFIANFNKDKVTDYFLLVGANRNLTGSRNNPIVGNPINALYSFPYAGLNSTGDPMGYQKGEESTDYTSILSSDDLNEMIMHGSRVPTLFGSLQNEFRYKGFGLSFLIIYKVGYHFRTTAYNSGTFSSAGWLGVREYESRWQQAGDEAHTGVPAIMYPANNNRDAFFASSSYLVYNASQIRFQDVRLNYQLPGNLALTNRFKSMSAYVMVSNLGLLWVQNKEKLDPDNALGFRSPVNVSFGVKASF